MVVYSSVASVNDFTLNKDLAACNILAKNNFFNFYVANNTDRVILPSGNFRNGWIT